MLLLGTVQKKQRAACRAPVSLLSEGSDTYSISLRVWVCHPNTRTHVRLLGPCFKTGRISPEPGRILVSAALMKSARRDAYVRSSTRGPWVKRAGRPWTNAHRLTGPETILPPQTKGGPAGRGPPPQRMRRTDSLASNDFTYYFTFSPKFFSPFPHGTCSLSVSRKYLALEGHYLPVSAAVPSNTTHWLGAWCGRLESCDGAVTLSGSLSKLRITPESR